MKKKINFLAEPIIIIDYLPLQYASVMNALETNSTSTTEYIEEPNEKDK